MRVAVRGGDLEGVVVAEEGEEEVNFMFNCKIENLRYNSLNLS
jgi:hypothetical protein